MVVPWARGWWYDSSRSESGTTAADPSHDSSRSESKPARLLLAAWKRARLAAPRHAPDNPSRSLGDVRGRYARHGDSGTMAKSRGRGSASHTARRRDSATVTRLGYVTRPRPRDSESVTVTRLGYGNRPRSRGSLGHGPGHVASWQARADVSQPSPAPERRGGRAAARAALLGAAAGRVGPAGPSPSRDVRVRVKSSRTASVLRGRSSS
jgi:hypothetical protein